MEAKRIAIIVLSGLIITLTACKKDNNKPGIRTTTPAVTVPLTTAQMLVGKWAIVKDSLQTFDFRTAIANPQKLVLNHNDFVIFNKDSTALVSSLVGYQALYTDYGRFYIDPAKAVGLPRLNFTYQVAQPGATLPPTLSLPDIGLPNGVAYDIIKLTANSMVLRNVTEIAKYPHDYIVKQDIYLSK